MDSWKVRSNAESGDGYSDISVEVEDKDIGIVIELKYAENAVLPLSSFPHCVKYPVVKRTLHKLSACKSRSL